MNFYRLFLPVLVACLLTPLAAVADHTDDEADEILRQLEENRRLIVAENMPMEAEAEDPFWSVYDEYREKIGQLDRQGFKLLRDFRGHFDDISDEQANEVMTTYFEIERETIVVRESYIDRFNEVLTPKQTLRFYQVENKLDSIIESDISSVTPLVPE